MEKSSLDSGRLPDHTATSQRPPAKGPDGVTAADIKRGYTKPPTERIPLWSPETDGGTNEVGNPWNYGGMLGRPRGGQR